MADQDEIRRQISKVSITPVGVEDVASSDYPSGLGDTANAFNLDRFKENFRIEIMSNTDEELQFDMIGVDASMANTVRRVLIAEVPTMAIESVFVYSNTSIMHDEILAHRLGLVPIRANPLEFNYAGDDDELDEDNHIMFELKVKCTRNPDAADDETDTQKLYLNSHVTTGHLKWIPVGSQEATFVDAPIAPVHDDILLVKLVPGQELDMKFHAVKGIGKDHAKWSPVGTASYRLLPHIRLLKRFTGDAAHRLAKCFAEGVIVVERGEDGEEEARVDNPRACTMSREVYRHEEFVDFVKLERIRDHFIFTVESIGQLDAPSLVKEAFNIITAKAGLIQQELQNYTDGDGDEMDA